MTTTSRYGTRLLLTCAAIGAAGGLLVVGMNYASFITSAVALYFYGATIGLWALPVLIAQRLLQRGGVAIITATVVGLVNAPLTPYGILQIGNFIAVGILLELPFLIFRYRVWSTKLFWIAHPVIIVAMSVIYILLVGFAALTPVLGSAIVVLTLAVAAGCTALSALIARRLRRAGVGVTRPAA